MNPPFSPSLSPEVPILMFNYSWTLWRCFMDNSNSFGPKPNPSPPLSPIKQNIILCAVFLDNRCPSWLYHKLEAWAVSCIFSIFCLPTFSVYHHVLGMPTSNCLAILALDTLLTSFCLGLSSPATCSIVSYTTTSLSCSKCLRYAMDLLSTQALKEQFPYPSFTVFYLNAISAGTFSSFPPSSEPGELLLRSSPIMPHTSPSTGVSLTPIHGACVSRLLVKA